MVLLEQALRAGGIKTEYTKVVFYVLQISRGLVKILEFVQVVLEFVKTREGAFRSLCVCVCVRAYTVFTHKDFARRFIV